MEENVRDIVRRYSIAVSSVAAVFGVGMLLTNFIQAQVSSLFLVAVLFAAWRGGLGAGLLATIMSVALGIFFFLPPVYSFSLKAEGVVELVVFTLAAVLTSSLSAAREQALGRERAARLEAESADRVKDEFVAAVSHELRTPLTSIKTLTSLMLRTSPSEDERREYLEDIATECDRQIDFVHNLLDLSRIDAGGVQVSLGRIEVDNVLKACEQVERVAAAARGHELIVEPATELPPVRADKNLLRRSLCAITENAIKYTHEGGRIMIEAHLDESEFVRIEVTDNGPGIRPEDKPHVFERFYRGSHADEEQAVSGIGLGLHLARELVQAMDGTITVESEAGRGTTFNVKVPVWTDPPFIGDE